jgi:hypothetical protein
LERVDKKDKIKTSERAMNLLVAGFIVMGITPWVFAAYGIWKWIGRAIGLL